MQPEPSGTFDSKNSTSKDVFRVASWNVNSIRARLPLLISFWQEFQPDVLCLQETKSEDGNFPFDALKEAGVSYIATCGQKSYNGTAVLSKHPIRRFLKNLPASPDNGSEARFIEADLENGLKIISVYVPNGEPSAKAPDSDERFVYKTAWLNALADYVEPLSKKGVPFVLAGDFNVIDRDENVYDAKKYEDTVFACPAIRRVFNRFRFAGLTDAAGFFTQDNPLFSFWDYQHGDFDKNHGMLLDYVFVSPALQRALTAAKISTAYRGKDKPSDHAPIVCDFKL